MTETQARGPRRARTNGQIWVFDVDGCLLDSLSGTSLRPGSAELLVRVREDGAKKIFLWSAAGGAYARGRAREQGIAELFDGFYDKAVRDGTGRYVTDGFLATRESVVFVDDRPEDLPVGATVLSVSPYLSPSSHDRALVRAARQVGIELSIADGGGSTPTCP